MSNYKGISTTILHSFNDDNNHNAHLTPIYASSTFVFDSAEDGMDKFSSKDKKHIYTRWGNPSFVAVEESIGNLESFGLLDTTGKPLKLKSFYCASGQAALTTLFTSNLQSGDSLVSHYSLYGGTQELVQKILIQLGINVVLIDLTNLDSLISFLSKDKTIKLIHLETPCNPTLQCVDIEKIVEIAHSYQIKVSVDNTFATPYLQQPFKLGADFVMHSTTKFLNGHGSAIGGILIGKDLEFMQQKVWKNYVLLGGNGNPFDAYLLMLGLKTLELRMERHCFNVNEVANYLINHPAISKVNFTGHTNHPQYKIALKQMKKPAPCFSFEIGLGFEAAKKFINNLKICIKAVSLGTADTLVCHPASMTHAGISQEDKKKFNITDSLIRMSVGLENIEDIIDDLDQALVKL